MDGNYAVDTNIAIGYIGRDPSICRSMATALSISIPSIVLGELYYGACKSARSAANKKQIELFREQSIILNCDHETAIYYGTIKNDLKVRGRPIPINDIWIAAIVMQHDLTLVTRDAHFNEVEGLKLAVW